MPHPPDTPPGPAPQLRLPEADARAVMVLRAFESPPAPLWTDADAERATREARRLEGEDASPARFFTRRAQVALPTLADRRAIPPALPAPSPWLLVPIGFALGCGSDAILGAGRVNLLAPHLWGLLAWNIAVYAVLVAARLARRERWALPAVARGWQALWPRTPATRSAAWTRFAADWALAAGPLRAQRVAAALHAAAAAFALGALVSLYAHGLAFDYRAGWDSTFLGPDAVRRVLSILLGPAALLSGQTLPDAAGFAQLRFASGGGENAAHWIHLFAITLGLVVLLPRALLSSLAASRAWRLSTAVPLPADEAYWQRLLHAREGRAVPVQVLPYSYHLDQGLLPGLRAALEREIGAPVAMQVAEPVTLGGEDELLAPPASSRPVALFALTATPEHENHGAFVRTLSQRGQELLVMVDESGFRRRFPGPDGSARVVQRRSAWQHMLHDLGQAPVFVDLAEEH